MKTIRVPADITIADPLTGAKGEQVSFQSWAFGRWLNNPRAADSIVKLCRWMQVVNAFKAAPKAGDEIKLEDEDHQTLLAVLADYAAITITDPLTRVVSPMPPTLLGQFLPFYDAVTKAT